MSILGKAVRKMQRHINHLVRDLGVKKMSLAELERDCALYDRLNTDTRFSTGRRHDYICRGDKYTPNGSVVSREYFMQDIWGARKVFEAAPAVHYDVGSSVAGFIAHLLAMKQKVILIDIRTINNDFDTPFLREGRAVRGGGIRRRGVHLCRCYEP